MWLNVTVWRFRTGLSSCTVIWWHIDHSVRPTCSSSERHNSYEDTSTAPLDQRAPVASDTTRLGLKIDPWFDSNCCTVKRHARRLERQQKGYGCEHTQEGTTGWFSKYLLQSTVTPVQSVRNLIVLLNLQLSFLHVNQVVSSGFSPPYINQEFS